MIGVNRRLLLLVIFVLVDLAVALAVAKDVSPQSIPNTTKVDAEQVIELVTQNQQIQIIDSRIRNDREHGFIEGSINLPDTDTNCLSLEDIIASYSSPVIFYCNGPKCGRSAVAVKIAQNCGYQSIYWFRGGFEEWLDKDYPVALE